MGFRHVSSPTKLTREHAAAIRASDTFDKTGLVSWHLNMYHDALMLEKALHSKNGRLDGSPRSPTLPLQGLKKIVLKEMKLGKVYRGSVLHGTFCSKTVKSRSMVVNVLEDESGCGTMVFVANAVPEDCTMAQVQKRFPAGLSVAVRNPYLHEHDDGIIGVLVEKPSELVVVSVPEGVSSDEEEDSKSNGEMPIAHSGLVDGNWILVNGNSIKEKNAKEEHCKALPVESSIRERQQGEVNEQLPMQEEAYEVNKQVPIETSSEESGELEESTLVNQHVPEDSKLVNQQGSAVQEESGPVSQQGSAVQEESSIINQQGSVVQEESTLVNQQGSAVQEESNPVNQQGSAVQEESSIVNQQEGSVVQEESSLVNQHLVNQQGSAVQEESNLVNDQVSEDSHLVNQQGSTVQEESSLVNQQESAVQVEPSLVNKQGSAVQEESTLVNQQVSNLVNQQGSAVQEESSLVNQQGENKSAEVNTEENEEPALVKARAVQEESTLVNQQVPQDSNLVNQQKDSSLVNQVQEESTLVDTDENEELALVKEREESNQVNQQELEESTLVNPEENNVHQKSKEDESTPVKCGQTGSFSDDHLAASDLRRLGNGHFGRSEWKQAVRLYSSSVRKAEKEGEHIEILLGYSNRAEAYLKLGEFEKARQDAQTALSREGEHAKSKYRMGRALMGLGMPDRALQYLEAAYEVAPRDKDLNESLKECKRMLLAGRKKKSSKARRKKSSV